MNFEIPDEFPMPREYDKNCGCSECEEARLEAKRKLWLSKQPATGLPPSPLGMPLIACETCLWWETPSPYGDGRSGIMWVHDFGRCKSPRIQDFNPFRRVEEPTTSKPDSLSAPYRSLMTGKSFGCIHHTPK